MGHIRRLDSNADPQAFPGALFEIANEVPQSQCSEAKIEGDDATTTNIGPDRLIDPGKFEPATLDAKICHITAGIGVTIGDYEITANDADSLFLAEPPGEGTEVVYFVTDGAELILTRNLASFAEFIHAARYAYTIKGGKLYTDMPNEQLKNACTILFDPLT